MWPQMVYQHEFAGLMTKTSHNFTKLSDSTIKQDSLVHTEIDIFDLYFCETMASQY